MATSQNITSPSTTLPDRRAALRSMLAVGAMAAIPVAASAPSSAEDPAFEAIKRYCTARQAHGDAVLRADKREVLEADRVALDAASDELNAAEYDLTDTVPTTKEGNRAKLEQIARFDDPELVRDAIASILRSPHWA
jgi:hypothetical protein